MYQAAHVETIFAVNIETSNGRATLVPYHTALNNAIGRRWATASRDDRLQSWP